MINVYPMSQNSTFISIGGWGHYPKVLLFCATMVHVPRGPPHLDNPPARPS